MENKKMDLENLENVSGGQSTSGMIWFTTHDVVVGPGKYLTIRYSPNGAINYDVGGWGNGESVLGDPNLVQWADGMPWRYCFRNGFFGWVNDNYLW